MKSSPYVLIVIATATLVACSPAKKEDAAFHRPYKAIVDTDLGGDPDDIQSLFRLLHYSDIIQIEGIVSTPCSDVKGHPWDTIPQDRLIKEWIKRVDLDYLRGKGHTGLMEEEQVLEAVKRGSQQPGPPAAGRASEGSAWIIEKALVRSPEDPLWILVWGSITTTAQALHDNQAIAPNIRIYYIGSTNTQHDSLSRNFVHDFMVKQFPALWWIENGVLPKGSRETFRGVYQGGEQAGEWGNIAFVESNIRGKGSVHQGLFSRKCGDAFPVATWPQGSLKEGDSPSILYLISPEVAAVGNVNDPTTESWGGTFKKAVPERYPNYYIDIDATPEECQATISKWRVNFLSDWKKRWAWYENGKL